MKQWIVQFGNSRTAFYTEYHAEQFMRALRLNGTQYTLTEAESMNQQSWTEMKQYKGVANMIVELTEQQRLILQGAMEQFIRAPTSDQVMLLALIRHADKISITYNTESANGGDSPHD